MNLLEAAIPVSVGGGTDDDTINVGDGTLDKITSRVTLNGGSGPDSILIHDELNTRNDSYTFTTSTSLTRTGLQPISFFNASLVKLLAGAGNNAITLSATVGLSQTLIDGGDGDDTVSMSGSYGSTNITVAGGNGADTLNYAATGSGSVNFWGGAGQDTLDVNSGTFTLAQDAQGTTQNLSINLAGSSILVMNASQHLAALKIQSNSRATLSANGSRVLVTSQLDATGKLDLTNNDLIVQATSATRLNVLAVIEGRIANAYNTTPTLWQGNGITSSTAAANASSALGVILNSSPGTIDGQSVDANSIVVRYTLIGDLNLDRSVSISDMITLASNFNQSGNWSMGDTNYDGSISIADFINLASSFNQVLASSNIIIEPYVPMDISMISTSNAKQIPDGQSAQTRKVNVGLSHRRNQVHHRHKRRFNSRLLMRWN